MTGVVFKIQANMDPNHRDRIAFMRVCSGRLTRGMKVKVVRTEKTMALNAPQFFFAQDRSLAEEAYAGDVVGIPNRGTLRIGDAITEGEDITFLGIPSFAPEILRRIRLEDAIRAKKLREALREMAEEGVVQLFSPVDGTQPIVGVIGALQLDVLADRLKHEYGLQTGFDPAPCDTVRWIMADDPAALSRFVEKNRVGRGHRPRRRAGVPRHLGLQPVLDRRPQPRDQVRRHQDDDGVIRHLAAAASLRSAFARRIVHGLHSQLKTKGLENESYCLELRVAFAAESLVQALTRQTRLLGDVAHAPHFGCRAYSTGNPINIVREQRLGDVFGHRLVAVEVLGSVERL